MRKSIGSWWAALGLLGAFLACHSDKPEAQVRRAFEACRSAVEAGDSAGAVAPLDPGFRGPENLDRGAAQLYLMALFRQEKVGVTVVRNEVAVQRGEVLQEVDLLLTGRSGGVLPQEASRRSFRLRWRKSGGAFRLLELQPLDRP